MKRLLAVCLMAGLSSMVLAKNKETVEIEVVSVDNSTIHTDLNGTGGSAGANLGIALAGGKHTNTDASTMLAIINGEHAKLDCFEHHKGCKTVAPGKCVGELDSKTGGIWLTFEMPLTHKNVRNHYIVAGGW